MASIHKHLGGYKRLLRRGVFCFCIFTIFNTNEGFSMKMFQKRIFKCRRDTCLSQLTPLPKTLSFSMFFIFWKNQGCFWSTPEGKKLAKWLLILFTSLIQAIYPLMGIWLVSLASPIGIITRNQVSKISLGKFDYFVEKVLRLVEF